MLSDLPPDVILVIIAHLDLDDAINLLSMCSSLHALSHVKDFWLKTLNRRPLACAPGVFLPDLAVESLRLYAIRAFKRQRNWSSPRPLPASVRTIPFRENVNMIHFCTIPGTPLLLTNTYKSVTCRDTRTGAVLAFLRLVEDADYVTAYRLGSSPPLHLYRRSLIPFSATLPLSDPELLLSSHHSRRGVAIVALDYNDEWQVSLTLLYTFSTGPLPHPEMTPGGAPDAAISATHACILYHRLVTRLPVLVYWRLDDAEGTPNVIRLPMRLGAAPTVLIHDGDFYLAGTETENIIRVHPVSGEIEHLLHPQIPPETSLTRTLHPATHLFRPMQGIMRIALTPLGVLHFSPVDDTLQLGIPAFYVPPAAHPGTRISRIWPGTSGTCAVILCCAPTGMMGTLHWRLELVRYHPDEDPKISVHALSLDSALSLPKNSVHMRPHPVELVLDDVRGVLYVAQQGREGLLVLDYAE
ncbi:hypothetical protein C8F01DRAFT_1243990 [Mycena amicta]|nr:hypothetical protein C8F01DRAFT_1243990 [Mycena amicta]